MEILTSISQIENKLKMLFEFEEGFNFEDFISKKINLAQIQNIKLTNLTQEERNQVIVDFSDLILQLKNYIFAISNFVRMLLFVKLEIELCTFVKRLFLGQIGGIKYVSTMQSYNFEEKNFDRFVEIVKNCDIERELYLPFVLNAFESEAQDPLFVWKRPAIEFMQKFFNENEEWTISYLNSHLNEKYSILAMITDFNTPRGIKMLVDDFCFKNGDEDKIARILKKYKRETFFEIDKRLLDKNANKLSLVQILFLFGSDTEALSRLRVIYDRETDEVVKNFIAERLDIMENTTSNKTEKQFLYQVKRKVKDAQERTLGLPFDRLNLTYKSGLKAENDSYTYIINLFKETNNLYNLKNLEFLTEIFEKNSLFNFTESVFEVLKRKEDIKCAKWSIRMVALLSSSEYAKSLSNFALELISQNRTKEAKYLIECLAYAGRVEVLDVLNNPNIDFEDKDNLLNVLIKKSGYDKNIVSDYAVLNKNDDATLKNEADRLFKEYINDRRWTKEYFDYISNYEPFKTLFEHIIFGEYRFNRLNNVFVLKNGVKNYIVELSSEQDYEIGIVHALDLDDRFAKVRDFEITTLFNQFNFGKYNIKDFNSKASELNIFSGMFIILKNYKERMKEYGFNANVENGNYTFSSFININTELNIACVVSLDRPATKEQDYSVLTTINFFKASDLIENNGKYSFSASNMLTIGSVPARYFDYCLSSILASAK